VVTDLHDKRIRGRARVERNKNLLRKRPLCVRCLKGHCAHRDDGKKCFRAAQEVDHIQPLAKGGKDSHDSRHPNLQPLCKKCHVLKTAEDFKKRPAIGLDGWPIEGST
jgi:5-methylcytosine-specific restriction endonuclease McrA